MALSRRAAVARAVDRRRHRVRACVPVHRPTPLLLRLASVRSARADAARFPPRPDSSPALPSRALSPSLPTPPPQPPLLSSRGRGTVDLSVRWTTGPEGMRSTSGEELTNWRAWEPAGTYEARLARRRGKGRGKGKGRG